MIRIDFFVYLIFICTSINFTYVFEQPDKTIENFVQQAYGELIKLISTLDKKLTKEDILSRIEKFLKENKYGRCIINGYGNRLLKFLNLQVYDMHIRSILINWYLFESAGFIKTEL